MNTQNKVILAAFSGLLAGFGIGYLFGLKNRGSRYLYEWQDVEDYGDEEDDYDLSSTVIGSEMDEDDWVTNEDVVTTMKAETESIK